MPQTSNPCSRCGKERVQSRTWKEHAETFFGDSIVVYTENVCPDKECQKLVDKEIKSQKEKRDKIKSDREQRTSDFKKKRLKSSIALAKKRKKS